LTGPLIHRVVQTARAVRAVTVRPPYVAPGHYYSPLTTDADTRRAQQWDGAPGVDLAEDGQLKLAQRMQPILAEHAPGPRYTAANNMYGAGDAAVYRGMLTEIRPRRIVEVGSGYSTALTLDEADANPDLAELRITSIEPYPDRLLGLLRPSDSGRVTLIRKPVQDVSLSTYEQLTSGDVLFIDSTHVVKAGSDVIWLFLHVLPRLAAGVVVHVHDVFWPFEYPASWLEQRRDWTEAYLVHAFLVGNADWEVLLFSSWLWQCHPERIPAPLAGEVPGSLWLRKVR
jgi:predicted O-methyltransferase YrrM